jgi:hypothetical protein
MRHAKPGISRKHPHMQGGHDGTHNLQPSMTGESSLYHIISNDGPAGPTWTGA